MKTKALQMALGFVMLAAVNCPAAVADETRTTIPDATDTSMFWAEGIGFPVREQAKVFAPTEKRANFTFFDGVADVVVCEGFVGNVILKLTEGLVNMIFKAIKQELLASSMKLALEYKPILTEIYKKYDYHEYGGAPLLGINGTALICHGTSKSRTIRNAIMASKKFHSMRINEQIMEYLSTTTVKPNGDATENPL